jgi:acyl-CoA synthetase (AMP-forming)/AMP-acid ligase II
MDTSHTLEPTPTRSGSSSTPSLRLTSQPDRDDAPEPRGLEPILRPEKQAGRIHDVPRLFFQWAETHGDEVFLRIRRPHQGKDHWDEFNFRRLRDESERLASGLWNLGVRRGDRVVIAAENSPEWIIALLGALRIGAIAVPIDPKLTPQEMENLFAGC